MANCIFEERLNSRICEYSLEFWRYLSSHHGLIDRLLAEVRGFCGEVDQEDDMTCVVVKVET